MTSSQASVIPQRTEAERRLSFARVAGSLYVQEVDENARDGVMAGKLFGVIGLATTLVGIVVGCAATVGPSNPFEASLANFSLHMQRASEAAIRGNAESTVSEFRLACEELRTAEATAPKDEAMLVRTLAIQCDVVLAEFAMGDMESAIAILEDLAWIASRLGPLDGKPNTNPHWMRCAVNLTVLHRDKCWPACTHEHYGPLLNNVADHCGGSDIQPSGGYLLTQLWAEAIK